VARTPNQSKLDISYRKVTFFKAEGTMRAGRPSLRWLDSAEKDLLGVRGWKTEALDKNLWRRTMVRPSPTRTVVAPVKKVEESVDYADFS
jgi:hypothetical protein